MTAPADETALIQLMESLGQIITGEAFISWIQNDLQRVFPHGAFICGVGRVHRAGVAPAKLFTSNFPLDYLQSLKQPDGLYLSAVMKNWLASGEVQLLDSEWPVDARMDIAWLERFKASGLQNIAAHGAYDLSRQYASYFSFHQIPRPLGDGHRYRLKLLVPHLHAALLRILHKIKADARAVRTDRTLTARELEVLTWVCDGKTSAEIASILGISLSTVRNQIQSTLVKLRVNTRSQAVAKAIKKGLVVNRQPDSQFGGF
ncbi:MAG: LuxR C-terminal-related transcriptional regulator [Thiobacillus sp.]|nr:LuxR C-terminal-related transcriptional regulator [Thiobacillus sp.]